jgi:hypothetical protein
VYNRFLLFEIVRTVQMAATGIARFGVRLSDTKGGEMAMQLRKIGAGVVGVGWDRMFAKTAAATQCSAATGRQVQSELDALKTELAALRGEVRGGK